MSLESSEEEEVLPPSPRGVKRKRGRDTADDNPRDRKAAAVEVVGLPLAAFGDAVQHAAPNLGYVILFFQ